MREIKSKKEIVCYNTDASGLVGNVERVFFPEKSEDVKKVVKDAKLDIVPRGAGTGLVGGCVPNNSIIVDMSKMNKVLNFNPRRYSVEVEAGITVKELNDKLNAVGFEFPIIDRKFSSIGGMIAVNICGDRSMRYGVMKEWIEGLEFVNGRGELMKLGKADLGDVVGMEGITGIIVKVKLRIFPKIKRSISIFQTDELDEILAITRRLKLEQEVVMLKLFPPYISGLLNLPEKYNLIIEFDSERGKIKGEAYNQLMQLKDKVYSIFYSKAYYESLDPKFFFDKIKEFILFLEASDTPYIADLGMGIVYPFFKNKEKKQDIVNFIKKARTKLGKYGIGLKRKDFVDISEKKIIQRVKLRHDPFFKLNKGKVVDVEDITKIQSLIPIEKPVKINPSKDTRELLEKLKTPEEKIEELIAIERERDRVLEIKKQAELVSQQEIKEKINDYEQTFSSELEKERREQVESFAKSVPRNIIEKQEIKSPEIRFEELKSESIVQRPSQRLSNYDEIRDIMTNKFGFNANKEIEIPGKVFVEDNLDRKSKQINDLDIINKIMTNKFDEESRKKLGKNNDNRIR